MKICSQCGYPDSHPLGITFNSDGVCSGCTTHFEKYDFNWHQRSKRLQQIVNDYKSRSGSTYDCIVPINGGTDSYYTVFYVKYILKLNPQSLLAQNTRIQANRRAMVKRRAP